MWHAVWGPPQVKVSTETQSQRKVKVKVNPVKWASVEVDEAMEVLKYNFDLN